MAMMGHVDLNAIPNLPGYSHRPRKAQHHRGQALGIQNGVRIEFQAGVTHDKPKLVAAPKVVDPFRTGVTLPESTTRETHRAEDARGHQELPAWDALDRHVLRFYGQFKEAVHECNIENHRIRNVVVLYYLEDDTAQVNEPKQDNSGIPQGTMVRRHRFPSSGGGFLTPNDFQVGGSLSVYGKVIKIQDADDFTRDYFRANGIEQERRERPEDDAFTASVKSMKGAASIVPRNSERLYREVELGGGHINKDMQQFLEWDRRVCRFFAIQDDLSTPQFERRPFIILYFLADDTVEIREQYPLNSGRDGYPRFYTRKPLPRGAVQLRGPMEPARTKADHITVSDFSVGQILTLSGSTFYIYNADGFTREYFQKELGTELGPPADVAMPDRAVPRAKTPPYSGFGSWDDSMASVTHLIPKAPRKDFNKLYNNDKKILRFTARLAQPKPEDESRLFVVLFDLADDTLAIHEPPQRNLGIITGKFLEKTVHMNQVTGQLFCPEDLDIGRTIKVHNREFEIIEMDEYTRKYRDGSGGKCFELQGVLEKIREGMRQQFPLVRDIFRKFDADKDGVITFEEFKIALQKWGFQLSDSDALAVMRHFDVRQDGQITYNDFCDVLLDEDYTTEMMKVKPGLQEGGDAQAYAAKARGKLEERAESEQVRKAVRLISDVMYKHTQTFTRIFKEFAHLTHEKTVTCQEVQAALMQVGYSFDFETVQRCVLFLMPEVDLQHISYLDFLKAMSASYHDVCRVR